MLSLEAREAVTPPVADRAHHTRIQPSGGWSALGLRELWRFRDLFVILAGRDVKLRYRQTALGVIWVILQPLLAALIFAVVFGRLAALPSDGVPYLLFVYVGLLPWNFFASALQRAGNSLISDSRLISKVYFPRVIVPIASTGAVLIDFLVAAAVLVVLLGGYRVAPTWNLLALPALLALLLVISVGISLWLSALNVYYRDFMYALPFVVQVWMYASPLVYSVGTVPDRWKPLYALNPMAGVIDGFRWAVLGTQPFPWVSVSLAVLIGGLCFVSGALIFRRVERSFADVV
jgi:lipopolysaccharide transport system permease protein